MTEVLTTLVVIPAWNEVASIGAVVRDVVDLGYPVLVVDDGSTDGTGDVARSVGARVLSLPVNLGVGGALRTGFKFAVANGFDRVVQCDADGQHIADQIEILLEAADRTGAAMVVGSRFALPDTRRDVALPRRLAMSVLARTASRSTSTRITDATSGFRVISRPLLEHFADRFPAHYLGDTYEAMVSAGRHGYAVAEVPVRMRERSHGCSSASTSMAFRQVVRAGLVFVSRFHLMLPPSVPSAPASVGAAHD